MNEHFSPPAFLPHQELLAWERHVLEGSEEIHEECKLGQEFEPKPIQKAMTATPIVICIQII